MPTPDRERRTEPPPRTTRPQARPAPTHDAAHGLQRAAGNRAVGGLLRTPVQRVIDMAGDHVYGATDLAAFKARYVSEEVRTRILETVNWSDFRQASIEAALRSPRHYRIRSADGAFKLLDDVEPRVTDGGVEWRTTVWPRKVVRPDAGSVGLEFSDLITCLGVLAERRRDDGRVEAASGLHFVTPEMVRDGQLTDAAVAALDELVTQVAGGGTVSVTLLRQAATPMPTSRVTGPQQDSAAAAALVTQYLQGNVTTQGGESRVVYTLSSDGTVRFT